MDSRVLSMEVVAKMNEDYTEWEIKMEGFESLGSTEDCYGFGDELSWRIHEFSYYIHSILPSTEGGKDKA